MIAPPKPQEHEELEALIKEARERQLRRRLLGAAGIAVAAALALGIYALIAGGSSGSTAGNSPSRSAVAPPCRSTQLAAQADFNHAGGQPGIFGGGVMIYNTSRSKCSLPHRPPVVLIELEPPTSADQGNRPSAPIDPARRSRPLIAHGAFAKVNVIWSNWCANPASAPTSRFAGRTTASRWRLD